MNRISRIVAQTLIASLLATATAPARADTTRDFIIQQQRDECQRLGGRYEYPKCYLPEKSPDTRPRNEEVCDWSCKLILGIIGAVATRAAYCKANPGKC